MKQKIMNVTFLLVALCMQIQLCTIKDSTNYTRVSDKACYTNDTLTYETVIEEKTNKPEFLNKNPEEGLREALEYYEVKYPNVVYAQAILETGNFKSDVCVKNNNLFGLYDSKNKRYYKFKHWSESVEAYIKYIQYKYDRGSYYSFLEELNYAKDPKYTKKLRIIVENE